MHGPGDLASPVCPKALEISQSLPTQQQNKPPKKGKKKTILEEDTNWVLTETSFVTTWVLKSSPFLGLWFMVHSGFMVFLSYRKEMNCRHRERERERDPQQTIEDATHLHIVT
jgi:hypothetical protein